MDRLDGSSGSAGKFLVSKENVPGFNLPGGTLQIPSRIFIAIKKTSYRKSVYYQLTTKAKPTIGFL